MSLLTERYGNYSFVQAVGASFKEVQKNPDAIRETIRGINRVIYALGLCMILGPATIAFSAGLKITEKTLRIYIAATKVDFWVNYQFKFENYKNCITFAKDVGVTIAYSLALPQLLYDLKVLVGKFPFPLAVGIEALDVVLAINHLHTLIPKAFEYRTDKPLLHCRKKIVDWNTQLEALKSDDKSTFNDLVIAKNMKVDKIDPIVLEAALITYAHDKKLKWEQKENDLPIRQKSNLLSIIKISLAVMSVFLIVTGVLTELTPIIIFGSLVGVSSVYFKTYSFLYDTFNPQAESVSFNHS